MKTRVSRFAVSAGDRAQQTPDQKSDKSLTALSRATSVLGLMTQMQRLCWCLETGMAGKRYIDERVAASERQFGESVKRKFPDPCILGCEMSAEACRVQ